MNAVINKLITVVVNPLVVLLFAVALLYFIWGVYVLYIAKGGEEDRTAGSQHVLYGVIGMAIMIAAFAIIHFTVNTLGSLLDTTIETPKTIGN